MGTSLTQRADERAPQPFHLHSAKHLGDLTESPVVASNEANATETPIVASVDAIVNCDSSKETPLTQQDDERAPQPSDLHHSSELLGDLTESLVVASNEANATETPIVTSVDAIVNCDSSKETPLTQQDDERAPQPFDLHYSAELLGDLTETPVLASNEANSTQTPTVASVEANVNYDSSKQTPLPQQDDERAPQPFDLHSAELLGDLTETPVVGLVASNEINVKRYSGTDEDLSHYLPLFKAARENKWENARRFLEGEPEAVTARISTSMDTALHVAALAGHTRFVKELVELMPSEALAIQDINDRTALQNAAIAGNIKAAKAMITKNSGLTQIADNMGWMPVLTASNYPNPVKKEIVWYLCRVTRDEDPSPFSGPLGAELIVNITHAGYYDIALYLLQRYPHLATAQTDDGFCMLKAMAYWPDRFPSGSRLRFWQRLIYSLIHVELEDDAPRSVFRGDMENPPETSGDLASKGDMENPPERSGDVASGEEMFQFLSSTCITQALPWLSGLLCKAIKLAPGIKQLQETKLTHMQAMKLLKHNCLEISRVGNSKIVNLFRNTSIMFIAAELGTFEIIKECIQSFPNLIWNTNESRRTIFHIAIENRRENIFNLINGLDGEKNLMSVYIVENGNNILHLAAKLAPSFQLNSVSGAALQIQRELQWYKEVEKNLHPFYRIVPNTYGKLPIDLFTEEHKNLVENGGKWMKDTAQSCMVVATLIATVVFAAAFTVPGGNISDINNSENGIPIFLYKNYFMLFAISDALALFSSSTSVLMFLSILTSRYAEEDFLKSLPRKLIIGLATLFFSIATMMIAFGAALSIVLGHRLAWVSIPVAIFACVPVTLFVLLQFPLFVQIVRSTYGSSIFESKPKLL